MTNITAPLFYLFFFVFGSCIGSFLNVCIYRIPKKESLIYPPSHCPNCQQPIRFYDNIPIISYLFLLGRCRWCGERISLRYPLIELITAIAFLGLYLKFGLSIQLFPYLILFSGLITVSMIDLEYQIIPDRISLPGIVIGLLTSLILPITFFESILGVLIGGGIFIIVIYLSKGGMGGGDIKLNAMIGAFLGWKMVLLTVFIGVFLGSIVGIVLLLLKIKGRKDPIPFGPFLSLGAVIAVFWGTQIIQWYFNYGAYNVRSIIR
ncbi:MAG: prepilin peptidase [bacterium]